MMKKTLKMAIAASVLTAPAMASVPGQMNTTLNNMSNPLYVPTQNTFYSKLSNSVRLKINDNSDALKDKNRDGRVEFPVLRIQEDLGYGITDRWSVHFGAQYTHDEDADRTGLSMGRLGTNYRVLNTNDGWVWDLYGDLHLGGIGKMRGQYNLYMGKTGLDGVFDYDNYSNGMWGYHVGTKFGKVWNNRLTTSAFVEVLRTIGDDNNTLRIAGDNTTKIPGKELTVAQLLVMGNAPQEISAKLKSLTEVNTGINAFYQVNDRWSFGGWFHYEHHQDNGIKKITTDLSQVDSTLVAMLNQKLEKLKNMQDGFDDYIIGLSVANQITEHAQVALYAEYVLDTAHARSQNGSDVKTEAGVRVNVKF